MIGWVTDPATDLPSLPAGYFWRVNFSSDNYGITKFFEVELRKKRWLGSRLELKRSCYWDRYSDQINRENIKETAIRVYSLWQGEEAALKLAGDYPPKRL